MELLIRTIIWQKLQNPRGPFLFSDPRVPALFLSVFFPGPLTPNSPARCPWENPDWGRHFPRFGQTRVWTPGVYIGIKNPQSIIFF